jgi:rRNA processing protein Krr1/Pno1
LSEGEEKNLISNYIVSKVEIYDDEISVIGKLIEKHSPEVASALAHYEHNPKLFLY